MNRVDTANSSRLQVSLSSLFVGIQSNWCILLVALFISTIEGKHILRLHKLMATIPIITPKVPFLGSIPKGVHFGTMVRIKGVINKFGDRCVINLQTGAALKPCDDVLLHLSIRPHENAIVRNSMQNQIWGAEERYGGCPIAYGQSFDVKVLFAGDMFKIAVNGTHFCTFPNRLPTHRAQFISIDGNCSIDYITTEEGAIAEIPSNPGMIAVCPPYVSTGPQSPYPSGSSVYPPIPPPPYTPPNYPGSELPYPPYLRQHAPAPPYSAFTEELKTKFEKMQSEG